MYCPYLYCRYRNVHCPYAYRPYPAVPIPNYRWKRWLSVKAIRKLIGLLRRAGRPLGLKVAQFLDKSFLGTISLMEFKLTADLVTALTGYLTEILPETNPETIREMVEALVTFIDFVVL